MKNILIILAIIVCFSCKKEKASEITISVDVTNDIVVPKHYIVTKTNETLKIDGIADESSWKDAKFTDNFIDIEGVKIPKFNTKIKMLWDNNYLYLYSKMEEPHVWGNLKQRDTIIFYNNDFEVFLDPSGNAQEYGEIEINALNTVWDLYLNKPYRVGGNADFKWDLNDLKSAVNIQGTLNNPNDIDSFWSVEMAIPLKPLIGLKNEPITLPKESEQWRINFSRVQWDHDIIDGKYYRKKENNTYLKEYNWVWSNQTVINMHEPEKWGYLQFTERSFSEDVSFFNDKDLYVKQTAFALFRKTRFGSLKHLLENSTGFIQNVEVTFKKGEMLKATFYKTDFGFEYKLESQITKKIYLINDEGSLKTL